MSGKRPRFRYYGHATVTFETAAGDVVMIDPWVMNNPSCPAELHEPERIDAILITHSHPDHFADVLELADRHRPKAVVANFEIASWLEGKGVENLIPMSLGGTVEVLGCRATMVRADHSSSIDNGDRLIYGGAPAGFVVEMGDGYTFYHLGDTALFGDLELIARFHRPQLGLVPIGDHFTMGPREAAWAVKLLGLREAVPIHYGTFPVLTGRPEEFAREVNELGLDCQVLAVPAGDTF